MQKVADTTRRDLTDYIYLYFQQAIYADFVKVTDFSIPWQKFYHNPIHTKATVSDKEYIDIMTFGPCNRPAYSVFNRWFNETGLKWTATNVDEFATVHMNDPRRYVKDQLTPLREEIYRDFERLYYPELRTDDLSGWGLMIERYVTKAKEPTESDSSDAVADFEPGPYGFDKGIEIVHKLRVYADTLIRILGTNFFKSFHGAQGMDEFSRLDKHNNRKLPLTAVTEAALGSRSAHSFAGMVMPTHKSYFNLAKHDGDLGLDQLMDAISYHFQYGVNMKYGPGKVERSLFGPILFCVNLIMMMYHKGDNTILCRTKQGSLTVTFRKPRVVDTQDDGKRQVFTLGKTALAGLFLHKCLYQAHIRVANQPEQTESLFERSEYRFVDDDEYDNPQLIAYLNIIAALDDMVDEVDQVDERGVSDSRQSMSHLEAVVDTSSRPVGKVDYRGPGGGSVSEDSQQIDSQGSRSSRESRSRSYGQMGSRSPVQSDSDSGEDRPLLDAIMPAPLPVAVIQDDDIHSIPDEKEGEGPQEEQEQEQDDDGAEEPELPLLEVPEVELPPQQIHHHYPIHYPVYQPAQPPPLPMPPVVVTEEAGDDKDGGGGAIMAVVALLFLSSLFRGGGGGNY